MTKKSYPKTARVSRVPRPSATPRPRTTTRPPTPDSPVVTVPRVDHFALLHPAYDDHPVDAMVDGVPSIAERAGRLRRLARQVQARCRTMTCSYDTRISG